jgi:hypothetical protein
MIRNGKAMHVKLLRPLDKLLYAACAVKQAVFGMEMQVYKIVQSNTSKKNILSFIVAHKMIALHKFVK